jgi:hypothetical protein
METPDYPLSAISFDDAICLTKNASNGLISCKCQVFVSVLTTIINNLTAYKMHAS